MRRQYRTYAEKIEGVQNASVNFASEKARIEFDAEKIDINTIKKTISELGYGAIDEASEMADMPDHSQHHPEEPAEKMKKRFFYSLVFRLADYLYDNGAAYWIAAITANGTSRRAYPTCFNNRHNRRLF